MHQVCHFCWGIKYLSENCLAFIKRLQLIQILIWPFKNVPFHSELAHFWLSLTVSACPFFYKLKSNQKYLEHQDKVKLNLLLTKVKQFGLFFPSQLWSLFSEQASLSIVCWDLTLLFSFQVFFLRLANIQKSLSPQFHLQWK